MQIPGDSLDDVLNALYPKLLGAPETDASRGATRELVGVTLIIANPRARLSHSESRGKPFSALGELLWYLGGSDALDFIKAYIPKYEKESDDGITVHGAYGPRLAAMRGIDQIDNVVELLRTRPGTRRAVIQLFNAEDINKHHREIPCTTTLQFLIRDERLQLIVTLRSNDAYKGLPHDVFCFTMLQEMVARRLGLEIGDYRQFVGSMHLYVADVDDASAYVGEGFQKILPMPPMPEGDPFLVVPALLDAERRVRAGEEVIPSAIFDDAYWADLVRLIQVFFARGDDASISHLADQFESRVYRYYLDSMRGRKPPRPHSPVQPLLRL